MTHAFVDTETSVSPASASGLELSIARAAVALLERQRPDGHFLFDLEADASIPAEYVLVKHILGEPDEVMERRTGLYLRRRQEPHGGWPMLARGAINVSASVKAYLALRAAGDPTDAPHMVRARDAILAAGGAINVNVFTRILLAYFGIVPWRAVPVMPVEIMLLPRWFPFHLSKISYWARATLVPLLVLMALKPRAANPRGLSIDELFVVPPNQVRHWPKGSNQTGAFGEVFAAFDTILRWAEPRFPRRWRDAAIARAVAFVRLRLNGEDGLGAIFPSIANALMMLHALGVPNDDPEMITARAALNKLVASNGDEAFCQPCLSPVWDTALVAHALMEAAPTSDAIADALDWLKPHQVLDLAGDWADRRPQLRPGGWAFQYSNRFYPDCDDTAVVALGLDRARRATGTRRFDEAISRSHEWILGMQSADGGWGAYDVDNTADYLNAIPFADHGALLDPSTPDVTGRCLSLLGQLGERPETSPAVNRALDYLFATQHTEGSWFGRWGINHIYGTWSVLSAFAAVGVPETHRSLRRGVGFLERVQNDDGGWGEDDRSYVRDYSGYAHSPSTASQTAWALIGLMAAGRVGGRSVARGIAYSARVLPALRRLSEGVPSDGAGTLPRAHHEPDDERAARLLRRIRWVHPACIGIHKH